MFNQQTWLAPGCTLLVMLRQRWITPSPSVCLSLAWSCLPTLKANICSFITFPLLLSSPVDALLTPSGPNMKSGLSLAAAALVAVLLSSVDAQGRKTAVHSQSYLHSLYPPPRSFLVFLFLLPSSLPFAGFSLQKFDASLSTWMQVITCTVNSMYWSNEIKFLILVYAMLWMLWIGVNGFHCRLLPWSFICREASQAQKQSQDPDAI